MINKYKPILLKILNIFKVIILILLVCFVIFTAYQKVLPNNPSLFGYRTFSIITDSMSPKLKVGDVILIKEKKAYEYKVGDIITFNGMSGELKGKIVTHEIVAIKDEEGRKIFYTKGIQNVSNDPAVYSEQVLGSFVYKFKIFSFVERIMSTTIGFILIIIVPLIFIYYNEIKDILKEIKAVKEKKS